MIDNSEREEQVLEWLQTLSDTIPTITQFSTQDPQNIVLFLSFLKPGLHASKSIHAFYFLT
jgi:hypothetical protein